MKLSVNALGFWVMVAAGVSVAIVLSDLFHLPAW